MSAFRRPTPDLVFDEANHRYTRRGLPCISVTQALSLLRNESADVFFTEGGRERGKRVHAMIDLDVQGRLDIGALDEPTLDYYVQWDEFRQRTNFQPILCEQPVYSDAHDVAGTLDLYGMLDGVPTLIDVKTGLVNELAGPQTAAYKAMGVRLQIIPATARRRVLDLKPNRWRLTDEYTGMADIEMFWHAVACLLFKLGVRR